LSTILVSWRAWDGRAASRWPNGTGQHDGAGLGFVAQLLERPREPVVQVVFEGIETVGSVQCHNTHRPVALDYYRIGHIFT